MPQELANEGSVMQERWPDLAYASYAPTAEYLHRVSQIGGKYAMFAPFSTSFGSVAMPLTARGFATSTLWANSTTFEIRYDILDDCVTIVSDRGVKSIALRSGSVADFYARFLETAMTLGLPALPTTIEPEIASAPHLDDDREPRTYDPAAAREIWSAFATASRLLTAWQAAHRGHHTPVGIMFGGFDLFAARCTSAWIQPPPQKPMFMQNSETAADVVVGFSLGDAKSRAASFYAYASPSPAAFASADFRTPGASFVQEARLAILPWDAVRSANDRDAAVLAFADAVYGVVRDDASDWPADLERRDGWFASKRLVTLT